MLDVSVILPQAMLEAPCSQAMKKMINRESLNLRPNPETTQWCSVEESRIHVDCECRIYARTMPLVNVKPDRLWHDELEQDKSTPVVGRLVKTLSGRQKRAKDFMTRNAESQNSESSVPSGNIFPCMRDDQSL